MAFLKEINKTIEKDEKGRIIHVVREYREEIHYEYIDDNIVHRIHVDGREDWITSDNFGRTIHYKDSNGTEFYQAYDENGKEIYFGTKPYEENSFLNKFKRFLAKL